MDQPARLGFTPPGKRLFHWRPYRSPWCCIRQGLISNSFRYTVASSGLPSILTGNTGIWSRPDTAHIMNVWELNDLYCPPWGIHACVCMTIQFSWSYGDLTARWNNHSLNGILPLRSYSYRLQRLSSLVIFGARDPTRRNQHATMGSAAITWCSLIRHGFISEQTQWKLIFLDLIRSIPCWS